MLPNRTLKDSIEQFMQIQQQFQEQRVEQPAEEEQKQEQLQIQVQPAQIKISCLNDLALVRIIPQAGAKRAPCDLVVVVDVSGSMSINATIQNQKGKEESSYLEILDIVKHAVITIIKSLEPQDRLALVAYSSVARTVFELLSMTEEGKQKAIVAVQNLNADGQTNLWDGLYQGLEVLKKSYQSGKNSAIFLLTDGLPNIEPPRGHIPMLKRYKDQNKQLSCSIHTFGFGYDLDSVLLNEIALEGIGAYSFIPDCSLVGTVFVHALSNVLTTSTMNTILSLESINGAQIESVIGDHLYETTQQEVKIQIGQLKFGQKKDFILKVKGAQNSIPFIKATLTYEDSLLKTQVTVEEETVDNSIDQEVQIEYFRLQTVVNVKQAMQLMQNNQQNQAQQLIQDFIAQIQQSEVANQAFIKDLLVDMTGQITEAFSKAEWYQKWGRHYLPSLIRAHSLQQCNNFKDPGVQHYGSQLFEQIRDKADDIFVKLPPPKPKQNEVFAQYQAPVAQVNMVDYHNRYAPCFHGQCKVLMADETFKQVRQIKKGDQVKTPLGFATVQCCIETKCQDGFEYLVNFEGGLLITPYHPIRLNNQWRFPVNIQMPIKMQCEAVYSFILDNDHVMIIDGVECVSLGHNFKGPIIEHDYFGSQKIIEDLKKNQGWSSGLIKLTHESIIRGGHNGMISQIV